MLLVGVQIVDPCGVHAGQRQRHIDAGDHQRKAPVPAAVTVHLADQVQVRNFAAAVHRHREGLFGGGFFRLVLGGLEADFNPVGAGAQRSFDVGAVTGEHVFAGKHLFAVDEHGREGVDHLGIQIDVLIAEQLRRHVEVARILPVVPAELLHGQFVAPVVRVRDLPRREQRGIVVARQVRRDGFLFPFGTFQRPDAAQIKTASHIGILSCCFRLPYNI